MLLLQVSVTKVQQRAVFHSKLWALELKSLAHIDAAAAGVA
jgi:hypothetical protein